MLESILFVGMIFVTRIVLPIVVISIVGSLIERALNHGIRPVSRHQRAGHSHSHVSLRGAM